MKKVYLINDSSMLKNAFDEKIYEVITMFRNDKISLFLINDNDSYKIYRKEKITFLEDNEEEIIITKNEYDKLKGDITKDNLDESLIKHIYTIDENTNFNVYEGKFEGLVTIEKEYNDELEFLDDVNFGIDITELDISNDKRLLNMRREEFEHEVAQIRMNYNIF